MLGSVAIQNPVSADRLNFRKSLSRSQSVGARRSIAYERRRNVGQHERQQRRVPLNPHTHHSSPSRTLPSTSFRKDVSLDVVRNPYRSSRICSNWSTSWSELLILSDDIPHIIVIDIHLIRCHLLRSDGSIS